MSSFKYTIEEIKEIAETNDPDAVAFISEVYKDQRKNYTDYEQGRIFQILSPKIDELLLNIRLPK